MTARRRVAWLIYQAMGALCLALAGLSGWWFAAHLMDMVLLQLTFYGAWWCLLGAREGGYLGAMMEEDGCSELDMGVLSSMGSMIGTLSLGLVGTAVTGLALVAVPWWAVFAATATLALGNLVLGVVLPLRVARLPHLDARGRTLGPDGRPLPLAQQPLRMPDRVGFLLALAAAITLLLTFVMALMMGKDLGHPVMMAPMMYGMFGTMVGGMLGGWLAGLLDEHEGHPDHDNPVMVSAMALMAGMMGGMPSGMIGGMMAIMGRDAIAATVGAGVLLIIASWFAAMRGRYRIERATPDRRAPVAPSVPSEPPTKPIGEADLRVLGMTCDACRVKVVRKVGALPGVSVVEVDVDAGRVHIAWADGFAGLDVVQQRIIDLGYTVESP